MNAKVWFVLSLALTSNGLLVGCSGESLIPGGHAGSEGSDPACETLGGTCLSDPMDVGFAADCKALGRNPLPGSCEAFNQCCCGPSAAAPSPPTCAKVGGLCLSDPMDVGFAADCEALGLPTLPGTCEAFNQSCCGQSAPLPPATCDTVGGVCLSDPMDVGFAADCEALGRTTLPGTCEAFNQSCCGQGEPHPPATCESVGGTCLADPSDPGFAADCEALGKKTLPGTCEAFNQSCCGQGAPPPPSDPCTSVGGTCMSDPGDPVWPAICENLGMVTIEVPCPTAYKACCAPSPSECATMGGVCMTDPSDPGFAASCEDLGMQTLAGTCPAFNESCCQG